MSTIRKIQPLTILSHCASIYYVGVGCSILAALSNVEALTAMHGYRTGTGPGALKIEQMENMRTITGAGMLFGVLACLTLAIVLCVKRNRSWLNPLISLGLFLSIATSFTTVIIFLSRFFWLPSNYLKLAAIPAYVMTGLLWASVGLLFLFLPFLFKKRVRIDTHFQFEQNEPNNPERNHVVNDI